MKESPPIPKIERHDCYDSTGATTPLGACYDEANARALAFYIRGLIRQLDQARKCEDAQRKDQP